MHFRNNNMFSVYYSEHIEFSLLVTFPNNFQIQNVKTFTSLGD